MDTGILRHRLATSGASSLRTRFAGGGETVRESGADTLFRARYACYLVLGFEPEQAFALATVPEVAIVDAVRLVENGCPHETAVSILV